MTPRSFPLVFLVAALLTGATYGQQARITTGIAVDRFQLSHDASSLGPALGSPTSILDYYSFVAPRLEASAFSAATSPVYFHFDAGFSYTPLGIFRDSDFGAAQALTSDTISSLTGTSADFTARVGSVVPVNLFYGETKLYAVATVQRTHVDTFGVTCIATCGPPDQPQSVQSTAQDRFGGEVGPGVSWQRRIDETQSIELRGEVRGGYLAVDESHLLRKDLGPMPNVKYGFWTVTGTAGVEYSRELTDQLQLVVGIDVAGTYGRGEANFAPGSPTPLAPLPANVGRINSTAKLSLAGQF